MYLNYRGISRVISVFLVIQGVALLPSAVTAVIYNEPNMLRLLAVLILAETALGMLFFRTVKPSPIPFRVRDGFLLVSSCWLLAGVLGALPFCLSGYIPHFADAFFESVSGFTTTGASILRDIEALPKSLLFYRCLTHWIGGFGIVFVPIALLPTLGIEGQVLAKAELTGPTLTKIMPKLSDSARIIFAIFSSLTILETILLMLGGLSFFDALTHAFSSISTGGFSNYNDSVGHFQSNYVYWVISIFMFLSGINFNLYYMAITGNLKTAAADAELRFYLKITGLAIVLITAYLIASRSDFMSNAWDSFTHTVFQIVSIMTTTGFSTVDYDAAWALFPKLILLLLMFTGACSSSTAGGMKQIRILMVMRMVRRGILIRLHPNAIIDIKYNGKRLAIDTLQSITSFAFIYFALIIIGTLGVSFTGCDSVTAFSASVACVSNIGPGFGAVGPAMNFAFFPGWTKIFLSLLMIIGRLELITMIVLFTRRFWNPNY